jgi:hypothetical protein
LGRLASDSPFEVVELGGPGGAFGFEGVEAAPEPLTERPVGRVGSFQLGGEPLLSRGEVVDLGLEAGAAAVVDVVLPVREIGQSGAKEGVPSAAFAGTGCSILSAA